MDYDDLNDAQKVQVAKGFDATPKLIPFIPYLLQDLFELGSLPEKIIEILDSLNLDKKTQMLDLACGKGAVSIKIAKRLGFRCKGIDLFKPFIETAVLEARNAGVQHLCQFEVMDIKDAVANERNYEIVILAAAESLLGEVDEAIGLLRDCISDGGLIIYDGAYLNEKSNLVNPDYGVIKKYKETLKQLTSYGDEIIKEVFIPVKETIRINKTYTDAIRKRVDELIIDFPDKKDLFYRYIKKQEEECSIIQNEITGCVWCIRKSG